MPMFFPKKTTTIIIPLILAITTLSAVFPASAAGDIIPCTGTGSTACTPCHIFQLIGNIIRFILTSIVAPLAGLLFLIGGIMMAAAGGSEERYKKGRKILLDTLIGVVIALAAWAIVNTVIVTIGNPSGNINPADWWKGLSC